MGLLKDASRIVNGVSLIAKEFVKDSEAFEAAKNGDLQILIKKAVVSATDLSGLTKGRVRHLPNPTSSSSSSSSSKLDSVVYFDTTTSASDNSSSHPTQHHQQKQEEVPSSVIDSDGITNDNGNVREASSAVAEDLDVRDGLVKECEPHKEDAKVEVVPFKRRKLRERRVPTTSFSRALGFAGLGAGLAWGTVQESAKRLVYGTPPSQDKKSALSPFLSEKNAERLALALCRMRGAALKIGQMLSIQDESLVPAPILAALDIVRQGADVMPRSQLNQVLDAELGPDWSSKLISFDYEPIAAASIGQVHGAVTKDGMQVAMKIQYPGVANSIDSDIENVRLLLDYTNLIPKGLYLDSAMKVAKEELSRECDYELEAANQNRFRNLLSGTEGFYVPLVVDSLSSKKVLTTELVSGIPIDKVALLDQKTRNYIGEKLLELTLMELFVFRFMQTDPNWSNFLYDEATKLINLIDFGAARDYPKSFVDDYLGMVIACANSDAEAVMEMSKRLGFLTGMESDIMLDAHVQAGFIVGLPFAKPGGYDFRSTNITQGVSNLGATMLKHRLTPPPDEVYSLHRKLSGAFLACVKLGAVVPCREVLLKIYEQYQFGEEDGEILSSGQSSS
ncbi:hypothetical protein CMV_008974 [Castanea mollissima]|uniref:ABC1 atypical kinase-like domain-containing protein n=1 Tax=Castanea mollissima TaxID=60419 RepID=A0A8J4RF50_9ROSI|nr:hypothetical protein CMV_008974 [Castanea mollissima]